MCKYDLTARRGKHVSENGFTIFNTKALTANNSEEFLSVPLVLEKSDVLKATISSTDSIHIGISYLSIT